MVLGDLFGGIAGANKSSKAHDAAKDARLRAIGLFGLDPNNYLSFNRQGLFDTRDQFKRESMQNIREGYRKAEGHLRGMGRASRQAARAGGKRQSAGMQQSMADRGLYNTTVMDNAQRGISADTSRVISEINQSMGQLRSQLELDRTEAVDTALGRNLGLDEQTAWDWFKMMVGDAGWGSGASNFFGFGRSGDNSIGGSMSPGSANFWGSIGNGLEDGLAAMFGAMGGGPTQMPGGGTAPNNYGPGWLG